jgi:hypothetical protein
MPEPWNIGLWGPASAGKTAFLAQLYRRSVLFQRDWEIFSSPEANQFLELVAVPMDQNRFPAATAITGTIAKVAYRFRHKISGGEASLIIEDHPGAESERLSEEGKRRFNSADALILLFDPERDRRTLEAEIERTLRRLADAANRGVNKDSRPIAICLTKADQMIKTAEDLRRATETPREFVFRWLTPQLTGWFARYCTNYEFFPVSSAGVFLRHGVVEQSVFLDEQLNLRLGSEGEPLNLMAPFAWLFDRIPGGRG